MSPLPDAKSCSQKDKWKKQFNTANCLPLAFLQPIELEISYIMLLKVLFPMQKN